MLQNRTDNYAAEGRSNDLPSASDSKSNPTKAMVDLESDLRIVNQKKAGSKCVAEREHASRKVLISFDYLVETLIHIRSTDR
jgi:hypothetical protein